jgi:hypothetical protein
MIGAASMFILVRGAAPVPSAPETSYFAGRRLPSARTQLAMVLGVPPSLADRLTAVQPPTLAELLPAGTR